MRNFFITFILYHNFAKLKSIINLYRDHKAIARFLLMAFALLMAWVIALSFFPSVLSNWHEALIGPQTRISARLLQLLGYSVQTWFSDGHYKSSIAIAGDGNLYVGDGCSGLELFLLFAGFILIMPGSMRNKLWFLPVGLALILALNIVRIVLLVLIHHYRPEWLYFNHKYTFVVIVYGAVFLLWMWWVNRFSGKYNSQ